MNDMNEAFWINLIFWSHEKKAVTNVLFCSDPPKSFFFYFLCMIVIWLSWGELCSIFIWSLHSTFYCWFLMPNLFCWVGSPECLADNRRKLPVATFVYNELMIRRNGLFIWVLAKSNECYLNNFPSYINIFLRVLSKAGIMYYEENISSKFSTIRIRELGKYPQNFFFF